MIFAGYMHFYKPEQYLKIMPPIFPAPLFLVYLSGAFEILGGLGLLLKKTRRFAAWGLIALFIAIFPANIYMAINNISIDGIPSNPIFLWLRLPLQALLVAWAYWFTKQ